MKGEVENPLYFSSMIEASVPSDDLYFGIVNYTPISNHEYIYNHFEFDGKERKIYTDEKGVINKLGKVEPLSTPHNFNSRNGFFFCSMP
jgi:hypothetical protein